MLFPSRLFRNLRIGLKLNLLLGATFIILLGAILLIINASIVSYTTQTGQQRVMQEITLITTRVAEEEQSTSQAISLLTTRPGLRESLISGDLVALRTAAVSGASVLKLNDVAVADANGKPLLIVANGQAQPLSGTATLKDQTALLSRALNGIYPTGVIRNVETEHGTLLIGAASPLQGIDNPSQIIGAVVGSRQIDTALLDTLDFGRDDVHLAIVYNHAILSHDDPEPADAGKANDPQTLNGIRLDQVAVDQALTGKTLSESALVYAPGQIPMAMGYAPFKIGNVIVGTLVMQIRLDSILTFGYQLETSLAVILVLLAVAVLGIAVLFSRQIITLPLNQLRTVSEKMARGDYDQRVKVESADEVGQLGSTFNQMTEMIIKRQTELRVATVKAREAARLKSEFLANISHELRTPLNAIIGFSDMFLLGMLGDLTLPQTHKMERLRENGTRLLTLINNVLDLTRIEARRVEVIHKPFSPTAMIDRLRAQMSVLAEQKQLTFNITLMPDLPETVSGDEQRTMQIVVNLLSNAIKFTETGSVQVTVSTKAADRTWQITVIDTGIGIPPHALDLIFEEFRQVDGSNTRAYQGSGLGLTIARNLARILGGEITVSSTLGKGSTFVLTLPIDVEAQPSSPLESRETAQELTRV